MTDEQKQATKGKHREEQRKYCRNMTDEQKQAVKQKHRNMTDEQKQAAKQKRRKLYLDQRTKKWRREAANCDVSKYPKQPFHPQKHVVNPDIFNPINAAKQFDQRTLNRDGSHQALVCVVCNELIKGVEPFCLIDKEVLWDDGVK